MKTIKKQKKGISLIVLIITIVVMVIIAGAIILALTDDDIINNSKEAVSLSNISNKKEAAEAQFASWELAVKLNKTTKSANDYVQDKLEKQGIDTSDVLITDEGKLLVGTGAQAIQLGIPLGAEVKGYVVENRSTTTDEITSSIQTLSSSTDLTWRYAGVDKDGNATIIPDIVSTMPNLSMNSKKGYLNAARVLNNICDQLYTTNRGIAKSIDLEDVLRIIGYDGPRGLYVDPNTDYVYIDKPLTIGELEEITGVQVASRHTPDGVDDIERYYSDAIRVYSKDLTTLNDDIKNMIFSSSYYLATTCVQGCFYPQFKGVSFHIFTVSNTSVGPSQLFTSQGVTGTISGFKFRPIVALTANNTLSYDSTTKTCTLK